MREHSLGSKAVRLCSKNECSKFKCVEIELVRSAQSGTQCRRNRGVFSTERPLSTSLPCPPSALTISPHHVPQSTLCPPIPHHTNAIHSITLSLHLTHHLSNTYIVNTIPAHHLFPPAYSTHTLLFPKLKLLPCTMVPRPITPSHKAG